MRLKSDDRLFVPGRGQIFMFNSQTVLAQGGRQRFIASTVGKTVEIDGDMYHVLAAEGSSLDSTSIGLQVARADDHVLRL